VQAQLRLDVDNSSNPPATMAPTPAHSGRDYPRGKTE
jgi:hypothetical protein